MDNLKKEEKQKIKEDRRIVLLRQEKPQLAVLKLGLPLIAGMMVMVLYNLVDTFFIGLLRDDYQLAAVNLAYPIMMIMIAISNMVGTGASSLIARSLGAGDVDKAKCTLTAGMELSVLSSLVLTLLGLLFLNPVLTMLGAKENTWDYTRQYVLVILGFSIMTMGNYTAGQLLRSEGSVKYSITGMVVGTIVNIILDPLLIFVFRLEILGAAIATVIGNGAGLVISLSYYARRKTLLEPGKQYLKPDFAIIKEIFAIGIPAAMETLLTSIAYIVNNNLAVAYGELTVAAMGVSQKILSLGSFIYQGFAAGVQPLMGYNYGAKNYKRMIASLKAGVLEVTGIEVVIMAIFGLFAPNLIALFTDTPEVVSIGSKVLRATMFILPFVGSISMSRTTFQAMGKPLYAFGITLVRQLILYIPLLLILNQFFGFDGLIWAQPITEMIMMAASVSLLGGMLAKLNAEKNS